MTDRYNRHDDSHQEPKEELIMYLADEMKYLFSLLQRD